MTAKSSQKPAGPSDWSAWLRHVVPVGVVSMLVLAWAPGVLLPVIRLVTVLTLMVLAAVVVLAVINVWTAPRLEGSAARRSDRPVSLLLTVDPDRDGLVDALPALLAAAGPATEILIVERRRSQETAALLRLLDGGRSRRARVLRTRTPPPGWSWRGHAGHRLGRAARGDVLVFCDSAMAIHGDAVAATLDLLDATGADAVMALPRPRLTAGEERSVVGQLGAWLAATLAPLALVPRMRLPFVAAGTSRWFAIAREAYDAVGGFAAVRDARNPEVALSRKLTESGLRAVAALAPEMLSVSVGGDGRSPGPRGRAGRRGRGIRAGQKRGHAVPYRS